MNALDNYIETLMPKLTQHTCKELEEKKTALKNIRWSSGESNLDMEFSGVAKKCCKEAFKKCNLKTSVKLDVRPPNLNLIFSESQNIIKKKNRTQIN